MDRGLFSGQTDMRRWCSETYVDSEAKFFHKVDRKKEVETYVFFGAFIDADTIGSFGPKLFGILSSRKGEHKITATRRFFNSLVNDPMEIRRTKIGGRAFDGTRKSITGRVTEVTKTPTSVTLVLDDQKGLGDNV